MFDTENVMCTSVKAVQYDTIKQIGDGGFGNVFKVMRSDGKELAAKVIEEEEWIHVDEKEDAETTISPVALRELAYLTLLTQVNAPCITPLLDFAFNLDDVYALVLIMPLYTGDLASAIKKQRLSLNERLDVACDLLEALAFLHGCNPSIVHRDVKPENLLLTAENRACLGDFGLASLGGEHPIAETSPKPHHSKERKRRRSPSPFHSGTIGTETYIAPEAVLHGGLAHPSLDLWAAGVTLFELHDNERLDADTDTTAIRRLRRWKQDLKGHIPRLLCGLLEDDALKRRPAAHVLLDLRRACKQSLPKKGQTYGIDLRTMLPTPSPIIVAACQTLKAKVPQTAQAAQRYHELAPDLDARLLAAVAYKVYEHRPIEDCKIMKKFRLNDTFIDMAEQGQEELIKRLHGELLTVVTVLAEDTQEASIVLHLA